MVENPFIYSFFYSSNIYSTGILQAISYSGILANTWSPANDASMAAFLTLKGRKAASMSFLDWVQSNRPQPRKMPLAKVEITLLQAVSSTPRRWPTFCGLQMPLYTLLVHLEGLQLQEALFLTLLGLSVQLTIPNVDLLQKLPLWVCIGFFLGIFGIFSGSICSIHPVILKGIEWGAFRFTRRVSWLLFPLFVGG